MAEGTTVNAKYNMSPLKAEQWPSKVLAYSSQYNDSGWSAESALGEPKVYPGYGDIQGAWAPGEFTDSEYIELGFEYPMFVKEVEIYETYNCGAIMKIEVRPYMECGGWRTVWTPESAEPERIETSRIFKPPIKTTYKIDAIRLNLNLTHIDTWAEIDTVKLIGSKYSIQEPEILQPTLGKDLSNIVNKEEFCDIVFEVEGQKVFAHKAVLSARSDYFRAMFSENAQTLLTLPNVVPMPDIEHASFIGVLHYLYTDDLDETSSTVDLVKLVRISDLYNMPGLKALATVKIYTDLSVENSVAIYREAVEKLPVLPGIEEISSVYISTNLYEVSRTPEFCQLPQELMLAMIQKSTENLKF